MINHRARVAPFMLLLVLLLLVGCGGEDEVPTMRPTATVAVEASEPSATLPASATVVPTPVADATDTTPSEGSPTRVTEETATVELPAATAEPTAAPASFDPATVTVGLETVADGFNAPLAVVSAGDGSGRLFVVEKGGRIWVLVDGAVRDTPLLDLSGSVSQGSEQGLLGLAFEPNRPERFYVNYTDRGGNTVIARYRTGDDLNVADPNSAEVLLTLEQPASNHNGGNLRFGPDGFLWIGTGDGGAAGDRFGNGQNAQTLLGAMLRLDVSGESGYAIPPDNPFADGQDGRPEIWAIGLRNPWRYSFDRATGDLWLADVGQNNLEEINHVPSGAPGLNYGWPIMEASACYESANCSSDGLVLPVSEYDHSQGCSVTGGYVYRGSAFPTLQGGYFFSDYCSGLLWVIPADAEPVTAPTLLLDQGLNTSSFGEDEAGELYLTDIASGILYHLVAR